MAKVFKIKRNDLLPELEVQLLLPDGKTPVPGLTGSEPVQFIMKTSVAAVSAKVDAAATWTDAPNAKVKYSWTGSDTDTAADHIGEFEVTIAGKKQTFPTGKYIPIVIEEDLG